METSPASKENEILVQELVKQVEALKSENKSLLDQLFHCNIELKAKESEKEVALKKQQAYIKELKKIAQDEKKRADAMERVRDVTITPSVLFSDSSSYRSRSVNDGQESVSSLGMLESESLEMINRFADLQKNYGDSLHKISLLESSNVQLEKENREKTEVIEEWVKSQSLPKTTKSPSTSSAASRTLLGFRKLIGISEETAVQCDVMEMNKKLQRLLEETLSKNLILQRTLDIMPVACHEERKFLIKSLSLIRPTSSLKMDDSLIAGEDADQNSDSSSSHVLLDVAVQDIQPEEREVEDNSEDGDDDDSELRALPEYSYQFFVLSQYGRPIFVSSGLEEKLCNLFAIITIFVSRVKAWGDTLQSFSAGDVFVHFMYNDPLILAVVSKRREWLASQLDVLYEQIISTLSKTYLKEIYIKKGDNYDLRRLLKGTDNLMKTCVSSFRSDPAVFLNSIRIFPLAASDRESLSSCMVSAISAARVDGLLFGIAIARRQLVSFVRLKKFLVHQRDVHILINLVTDNKWMRVADNTFVPICMPHCNDTGFLYAYITYPLVDVDLCLIMLSCKKETNEQLEQVKKDIVNRMMSSGTLVGNLAKSIKSPSPFDIAQIGQHHDHLWYFVYKNTSSQQMCMSGARPPYVSRDERRQLVRTIATASFLAHANKNLSMAFVRRSADALFIRWTEKFELVCVFSPLITQSAAAALSERLQRALKSNEHRYFITHTPSYSY